MASGVWAIRASLFRAAAAADRSFFPTGQLRQASVWALSTAASGGNSSARTTAAAAAAAYSHAENADGGMRWPLLMATTGAAGLFTLMGLVHADVDTGADADADVASISKMRTWLSDRGVDLGVVDLGRSEADGAGYGMIVATGEAVVKKLNPRRSWLWPFSRKSGNASSAPPLASFPLAHALTAANILRDPVAGQRLGQLLEHEMIDERMIVMAYLIMERLKGSASELAPWMELLPTTFDTPLMFDHDELAELAGTPVAKASAVISRRLQQLWTQMQPVLSDASLSGPSHRAATFEDLLWAYNIFWSRAQSLPVTHSEGGGADPSVQQVHVHEGIVPGLDFCNHDGAEPRCWWEVALPPQAKGTSRGGDSGAVVQLRLSEGARVRSGDELRIAYGDKSNEELLMLYGFVLEGNPHDHIMVYVPLPPRASWDDNMHARMELISACGVKLQFFLPGIHASVPGASIALPADLLHALEVFALTPAELSMRLAAVKRREQGCPAEGDAELLSPLNMAAIRRDVGEGISAKASADTITRLGLRLGALAAAIKILEARVEELEGASGSGTLEQDEVLLASMKAAGVGALSQRQRRRHACVVYRCEQKRITREYLKQGHAEMQEVLRLIQDVKTGQGRKA